MNHMQHNLDVGKTQQQDLKFSTAGDVMREIDQKRSTLKEYSPQSMIDEINEQNNRQSVERVYSMRPTGGESWQKGSRMISQQIFPQDIVPFIDHNADYFSDDEILALLRGIDTEFTKRFGTDPYSRLIKMKVMEKDDTSSSSS